MYYLKNLIIIQNWRFCFLVFYCRPIILWLVIAFDICQVFSYYLVAWKETLNRTGNIYSTSRSSRPTDVLWLVAKGVALSRPFEWSENLRHISEFSSDPWLLNAKGTCQDIQPFSCNALLGCPACLRKFMKIVWIIGHCLFGRKVIM